MEFRSKKTVCSIFPSNTNSVKDQIRKHIFPEHNCRIMTQDICTYFAIYASQKKKEEKVEENKVLEILSTSSNGLIILQYWIDVMGRSRRSFSHFCSTKVQITFASELYAKELPLPYESEPCAVHLAFIIKHNSWRRLWDMKHDKACINSPARPVCNLKLKQKKTNGDGELKNKRNKIQVKRELKYILV